jgi:23S rRNA pseudouridine1911/1915/1917 synthase
MTSVATSKDDVAETPSAKILVVPPADQGRRLDQWLVSQLPDVSRARVQQLIEQEKVTIAGVVPKPSLHLRGGEEVVIRGPVELPPLKAFPEDIPLEIVYEDAEIAVLNKPAGMTVHAGSGKNQTGSRGTLVNALLHRFKALSQLGGELRPGIVHRLDKETSGLMVVAKTDRAHSRLARQFARREVKKTYLALVHGAMKQPRGTITASIRRDPVRRARMTTRSGTGSQTGRSAITHWKLVKTIEKSYGKFSLLEVTIETGRTHQIRVHLASIGHPVVGDTLYGAPREITGYRGTVPESLTLKRNFLHASGIQFQHPISNQALEFRQSLPSELKDFLGHAGQ